MNYLINVTRNYKTYLMNEMNEMKLAELFTEFNEEC